MTSSDGDENQLCHIHKLFEAAISVANKSNVDVEVYVCASKNILTPYEVGLLLVDKDNKNNYEKIPINNVNIKYVGDDNREL